nr:N-6 DNA methylase [uncultured Rhodopila sp.]
MARKPVTDITAWPALALEGNLLSPAMIAAIDRRDATEQDDASYGIRKGLTLREEISLAFRVGQAHVTSFRKATAPSATATATFVRDFLRETLGFADLAPAPAPLALTAGNERIPIVVVPPSDALDRRSATLSHDRARSAALALQDHLNGNDSSLWGITTNGLVIRLMRDNASLTRPAFIEVNLAQIFDTEDMASFAIFWLLFHRSRFGTAGTPATDCALERWRDAGAKAGEVARDRLAAQVEQALKELGSGFLEANRDLRDKLIAHEIPLTDWFNELLRLVYQLIFLMVAEDRDLLHAPNADGDARRLYAEGYSLATLRALSARRAAWDRHHDRYEGLKIVFRALAGGEPRLGLPALGGLFLPGLLGTLEAARLTNRAFLSAIFRLGWLSDGSSMAPVNWRAMETEELGSVYESLLELQPQLANDGRSLVFASGNAEQRGNQRKTTGSYYTPDSLVQLLLDTTLDPLLDRAEFSGSDPIESLLKLSVIDPACGSGHFLLAAARRIATRIARHRASGTPSAIEFRHALRDVARRCIFGVDRNPMAVELTKVALWIETVDPGLPLGFFEAQIRCGDSLIGIFNFEMLRKGLPDAAFEALTGDDEPVARAYLTINKEQREGKTATGFLAQLRMPEEIASGAEALLAMPEDTLQQVEAKRQAFEHLISGSTWWRLKTASDMYVAAFLMPKRGAAPNPRNVAGLPVPTTEAIWRTVQDGDVRPELQAASIDLAMANRAFHWPLEFPAIMANGGFDAVVGNPPWEVSQLSDVEFFAVRDQDIAVLQGDERKRAIKRLEQENSTLWEQFNFAIRTIEASNTFFRSSDRFPLTAVGKINTYPLFAEHFACLARARSASERLGRAGVLVPTGIATDASTSSFFGNVVAKKRLAALFSFNEVRKWFKDTDERKSFCVFVIGENQSTIPFVYDIESIRELHDSRRVNQLSADDFCLFNPNTLTAPLFRTGFDMELTHKLYRAAPVLIRERPDHADGDDNPWEVTFQQGLYNMASASAFFRTARQLAGEGFGRDGPDWRHEDGRNYVPLFEAKMIHHFDHRFGSYAGIDARPGDGSLPEAPDCLKADPGYEAEPWYWVPEDETRLRVARVPSRLKQYSRKDDAKGCMKVLAEWVVGTLDPDDFARPAHAVAHAERRLKDTLGPGALDRSVIGARLATWLGKVAAGARQMQRETPLSRDDLAFIRQAPLGPLELAKALIDHKQPRWLMGWRDICRSTDERTVIASVLPKVGVGHKLPLVFSPLGASTICLLTAQFTSLVFDYAARQKLAGTDLSYFYLKQMPVVPPQQFSQEDRDFIISRVVELTYTSRSIRLWAEDLGHLAPPFGFDPTRRAEIRAELDAYFARKHALSREELRYILDPTDVKGDSYPSETFRGLKRNEEAAFGEYRTSRLILAAWDRMEADGTFRAMGM